MSPRGLLAKHNTALKSKNTSQTWFDRGANFSFVHDKDLFSNYQRVHTADVDICEGQSHTIGEGQIHLPIGKGLVLDAKHAHM